MPSEETEILFVNTASSDNEYHEVTGEAYLWSERCLRGAAVPLCRCAGPGGSSELVFHRCALSLLTVEGLLEM